MFDYLKNLSLFLIIGLLLNSFSLLLKSSFLSEFLDQNLITILFALLAINTATISVIMTKLREITEQNKVDFSRTIKSMKVSIIEQVWLIGIAVVVLSLRASEVINNWWDNAYFIFDTLSLGVFAYAIHVLYDTANGVFVILKHENEKV